MAVLDTTNLEGRVIEVKYNSPNVSIVICGENKTEQATLPIQLQNELELIPYQLALLGQQVNYTAIKGLAVK